MDDHLDLILEEIYKRTEEISRLKYNKLTPGSLVRFNSRTRPKYLIGVPATVVRRKQKRIVVKIGQTVGRFDQHSTITTDPKLLDVIQPPGHDD